MLTASPSVRATSPTERLGFWIQEQDILPNYTPAGFFDAMFLTSPYPSSMEMMITTVLKDESAGLTPGSSGSYSAGSLSFWEQVASYADAYPNIRLIFEIALDGTSSEYGLSALQMYASGFASHPSVYAIGIMGEISKGMTASFYQSAMSVVTAAGKQFINYYPKATLPSGATYIKHTNFPGGDSGGSDQVGTLTGADSQTVGLSSGYYAQFQFPGAVTCPIGPTAMSSSTWGWNQCVIQTELATAVSMPSSERQFLEFCVGFPSTSWEELWANPTLRGWIWTDPNYQSNFILSTNSAQPATTTTSSTSSSLTSTRSSTTTSTSSPISTTSSSTQTQTTTKLTTTTQSTTQTQTTTKLTTITQSTTQTQTTTTSTTASSTTTSSGGTLAVDSSVSGTDVTGTSSVTSGPFSTSKSPDIIIVMISQSGYCGGGCSSSNQHVTQTVSSVTDSLDKLVFTKRVNIASYNGHAQVDEWYAIASTTLSSDTITITLAAPADAAIYVYGISGANTASPFDSATLPATAAATSSPISTTMSTKNANDMLIFGLATSMNSGQTMSITSPPGTTNQANSVTCDSGGNCVGQHVDYEIVSSTVSVIKVGWSVSTSHSMAGIADAIVKASTG